MIIELTLFVIIMLSVLTVILGQPWTSMNDQGSFGAYGSMSIEPIVGAIGIIAIIIIIAVIFGINIMGSGLSENSVHTLTIGLTYTGLWTLFSTFASPLLLEIKVFGSFLYIMLTIGYVYGVIKKITER